MARKRYWRRHKPTSLEDTLGPLLVGFLLLGIVGYMLKGMAPAQFEIAIANMLNNLGFSAQAVGGANDGGIDVVAHKDGKKYYIQCKKFMTREVTPHDVRDFLGAITNVNNPADRGYFVTTGGFTLRAKEA